jgi:CheY-like chemotaxis protein
MPSVLVSLLTPDFSHLQRLNGCRAPTGTAGRLEPVSTGGNGPLVLVVDDEPALRLLWRVNLELEGYGVREAGTLAEAREAIAAEPVAVVLLDLHVGRERGDTLLAELRARQPRIPVALVTGSVEVDEGGLPDGADAVIAKPFTIDLLMETVRQLAGDGEPR